jgi:hypothetical protein
MPARLGWHRPGNLSRDIHVSGSAPIQNNERRVQKPTDPVLDLD